MDDYWMCYGALDNREATVRHGLPAVFAARLACPGPEP